MAAPAFDVLARAYPGLLTGIGQDPAEELEAFAAQLQVEFPSVSDTDPYDASNAYEIENVPTLFIVDSKGRVADVVESWDRAGVNRASETLAGLLDASPVQISDPADGLPGFRPG